MPKIAAAGRSLEYQWLGKGAQTLVFLHEGLGSIGQWREFPAEVARATGCRALVYDRYGFGKSEMLAEPRVGVEFMHDAALNELPELLENLDVRDPILIGHSDGASIALIHAGTYAVKGVAAMAPHVFIEDICIDSIAKAAQAFETTDFPSRLGKYHKNPRKTFHLWADAWLDPAFRDWNIEEYLPRIDCPLLAIQGEGDEYGTMAQLDAIKRQVSGPCELVKLPDCGHSPHKDKKDETQSAIVGFVERLRHERSS